MDNARVFLDNFTEKFVFEGFLLANGNPDTRKDPLWYANDNGLYFAVQSVRQRFFEHSTPQGFDFDKYRELFKGKCEDKELMMESNRNATIALHPHSEFVFGTNFVWQDYVEEEVVSGLVDGKKRKNAYRREFGEQKNKKLRISG